MARKKVVEEKPRIDPYLYPGYPPFCVPTYVGLYDGDWCLISGERCRTNSGIEVVAGIWAAYKLVRGLYPNVDNRFFYASVLDGDGNFRCDNRGWAIKGCIGKGDRVFKITDSEHAALKERSGETGILGYIPVLIPMESFHLAYVGAELTFAEVEQWEHVDNCYQMEVRSVKAYCDARKGASDVVKEPRREAPKSDAEAIRLLRASI